jgi:transmembrane sensor
MSALPQETGATRIDLLAADWLQRRQFWDWSEPDQQAFDAWLAESDAHRVAYLRQSAVWNSAERLVALRSFASDENAARKPARPFLIRVAAAAFIALAIGGASVSYLLRPGEVTYSTPVGGHSTVALGDGSRIELNTDSVLRVAKDGDARYATLVRGEAYFEIKHNAAHPFVVSASTYRVTDLGTKFLVRNISGHFKVGLVEGSAQFESTGASSRPVVLTPGDVVVADAASKSVTKTATQNVVRELSWRIGLLNFQDTTLEAAAAEFNRYNNGKLIFADSNVARLKINGTFQARNTELFVESAKEIFGLHATKVGSETVISR